MRVEVRTLRTGVWASRTLDLGAFSLPLQELRELLALFFEEVVVLPLGR